MITRAAVRLIALLWMALPLPAFAVELVMVEQPGCTYCAQWHQTIAPIYPKTAEGAYAPLRVIELRDGVPADLKFARRVVFTPTFILIDDGQEVGRIEGYPGEDFFWGLLDMLLKAKTDFSGTG